MHKRQPTPSPPLAGASPLQLLTVPEVAQLLSVGCTKVYALIRASELETVCIGTARRVPARSVQRYIEEHITAF
jgi:excisionase family DNA binding protein